MPDVSFNEEQDLNRYSASAGKKGGISQLLIRIGIAKTERQANAVMIGVIVVAMGFIWA